MLFDTLAVFNDEGCDTGSADTTTMGRIAHITGTQVIAGDSKQQYVLYPNPNSGIFTLQQQVADDGPVMVEITDAVGRSVYHAEQTISARKGSIDVGNVSPGMYLLQLTDSKGRKFVFKFVIE